MIDAARLVITRHSYCEGSSGGDSHDRDELPIEQSVISDLRMSGYIHGTPHWGYTDDNELQISRHGESAARDIHQRKRDEEEKSNKKGANG